MRSIVKWIIYVPVCLLSLLLIFFSCLAPESVQNMLNMDQNGVARIVTFSVVGIFALFLLFSFFDRSTSPIHLLKKNYFCGITALLTAFSMAAIVALDASSLFRIGEVDVMSVITLVFTMLAAVALLFIGLNHITGSNSPRAIAILYLALPLWSGVHLVSRFLDHTASPVAAADTLDLVMFVSLALSTLYFVMVHSQITGKNAVKSAVVFGAPSVVATLTFAITQYFSAASNAGSDFLSFVPAMCYTFLGLYVFGFTCELSFSSKTKDEQIIVEPVFESSVDTAEDDSDTADDSFNQENLTFDTYAEPTDASDNFEEAEQSEPTGESVGDFDEEYTSPVAAKIRIVDDESDEAVGHDDAEPVSDDELDSLRELYSRAKDRDKTSVDASVSGSESEPEITVESDDEMIIKNEDKPVVPQKNAPAGAPKGKTVREPILIEDDFILSINGMDSYDQERVKTKDDDDASAYIMESLIRPEDDNKDDADINYESRLDEIDQLILSIEGGKRASDTSSDDK